MVDWSLVETEVIALLIVWSPVEVAVLALVFSIYRKVGKLAASMEMMPDLNLEDRKFVRWWSTFALNAEKERIRNFNKDDPNWRAPW
jgi:hypothetical protein